MKISILVQSLLAVVAIGTASAGFTGTALPYKLSVTPEIKKAFHAGDAIDVREITGTTANFQVGGTYRVTGVCRQHALANASLYFGNSAEAGPAAIVPLPDSSLYRTLLSGSTAFDCTFKLLRPGIVHLTVYDLDNHDRTDNSYEGIYLGHAVYKH